MSDMLEAAFIAGGAAVTGSFVTGWFTYMASVRQREAERYKRRLIQAYKDIIAFYRLEELYTKELTSEERTAESWKRDMRKKLRDSGNGSPSEEATSQRCEQRLQELS
jgi:hypothetical protein